MEISPSRGCYLGNCCKHTEKKQNNRGPHGRESMNIFFPRESDVGALRKSSTKISRGTKYMFFLFKE